MKKEKPYNNGTWTEARFNSFIKGMLRQGSMRWSPIFNVKKKARIKRGYYLCAECGSAVPASYKGEDGKRHSNVHVDHIHSVVPLTGFTTWDDVIERLFVEEDGLQLLCHDCHSIKTKEERDMRLELKGLHKTYAREYNSWRGARKRCYDVNHHKYQLYGERGITVSPEWGSFKNFLADMGERPEGYTLERIDGNGNYCKENCKWASIEEQNRNRSNNIHLTHNGETKTMAEWARDINISSQSLSNRLASGWSVERSLSTPPKKQGARLSKEELDEIVRRKDGGESLKGIAEALNRPYCTITKAYRRHKEG